MFISAVIDLASSNVDQKYEYHIPQNLEPFVEIGKRIKVNFNNMIILGYIIDIYEEQTFFSNEVKDIIEILDFEPILSKDQLVLAQIIKEECICPLVRILNLMVPKSLKLKSYKYIKINNKSLLPLDILALFKKSDELDFNKIPKELFKRVQQEVKNNNLIIVKDSKERKTIKYYKTYYVNKEEYNNNLLSIRSFEKRYFLKQMFNNDPLSIDDILENYEITLPQVKDLIKKGFLLEEKTIQSRIKERVINQDFVSHSFKNKTEFNQAWLNHKPILFIPKDIQEDEDTLLDLCKDTILKKQRIVIFCPEILTTYKYASLIKKYLNINTACINSNLSDSEYYDYYQAIRNNEYDCIVTSQKGIFLPFQNVGLYYLLNEDSDNYYSDQSPRYDLHHILIYLSRTSNANLVMSSLVPSVNSYCNGLKQYFNIIDHSQSSNNKKIELVNMIDELKEGNTSFISNKLNKVINNIDKQQPINHNLLLILNNKNYSSHVLCRDCGEVSKCERCNVSLNYHEKGGYLVCPSCNKHYEFNNECLKCHSKNLLFGGIGIELLWKNLDKIAATNQYHKWVIDENNFELLNEIHSSFDEYPYNIVISTDSISKSMPTNFFDNVSIINFDSSLKAPSFDAGSRCYSMLENATSLLNDKGSLIIQTSNPTHYVIKSFLDHNYKAFIKEELALRKLQNNIPYKRINRIIIKAKYEEMFKVANTIKSTLISNHDYNIFVLGPTYSKKEMGAVLLIKHNSKEINKIYKNIYELYQNTNVTIIFDKHPRSL